MSVLDYYRSFIDLKIIWANLRRVKLTVVRLIKQDASFLHFVSRFVLIKFS